MNNQEQVKKVVQALCDMTKHFATSRHYTFAYGWISSFLGVDFSNKEFRDEVWEMSYSLNEFCDLIQTMDFDDDKKEVTVMLWASNNKKKYTIDQYEEFCKNALIAPPIEEFEDGSIDEDKWYKEHNIHIVVGNHDIELWYGADNVNEIEYALKEMYAAENDGPPTTGNTVGSEYRPAELKDVVRYFIMRRYEEWGGLNWFGYAKQAVVEMSDIQSVIGVYEYARSIAKELDFKCNWHNFKFESLKDATEDGIKKIILDLVGSNLEISYDSQTDKSFIIDYTFRESGDFIDWSWGNLDRVHIDELVGYYKEQIFEEE